MAFGSAVVRSDHAGGASSIRRCGVMPTRELDRPTPRARPVALHRRRGRRLQDPPTRLSSSRRPDACCGGLCVAGRCGQPGAIFLPPLALRTTGQLPGDAEIAASRETRGGSFDRRSGEEITGAPTRCGKSHERPFWSHDEVHARAIRGSMLGPSRGPPADHPGGHVDRRDISRHGGGGGRRHVTQRTHGRPSSGATSGGG